MSYRFSSLKAFGQERPYEVDQAEQDHGDPDSEQDHGDFDLAVDRRERKFIAQAMSEKRTMENRLLAIVNDRVDALKLEVKTEVQDFVSGVMTHNGGKCHVEIRRQASDFTGLVNHRLSTFKTTLDVNITGVIGDFKEGLFEEDEA